MEEVPLEKKIVVAGHISVDMTPVFPGSKCSSGRKNRA